MEMAMRNIQFLHQDKYPRQCRATSDIRIEREIAGDVTTGKR